jgi:hypothetical protein
MFFESGVKHHTSTLTLFVDESRTEGESHQTDACSGYTISHTAVSSAPHNLRKSNSQTLVVFSSD